MTLIASFSIDDTSFLLGDLLLSTPIRHSRPVHLPSIGQPAHLFPASSLLVPHSLARKVCQFSNLSIAWAGNYGKAKTLITRLFEETQNTGPIPYDTLQTLLPKLDPTHKVHLQNATPFSVTKRLSPSRSTPGAKRKGLRGGTKGG